MKINTLHKVSRDNTYVVLNLDEAQYLLDTGFELIEVNRNKNKWEFVFYCKENLSKEEESRNKIINRTVSNIVDNILNDEYEISILLDEMAEEREDNMYGTIKNSCDDFIFS